MVAGQAKRAHESARRLYLGLYDKALAEQQHLDPVEQHFLADRYARSNTGPYVTSDQNDEFEADALLARAMAFGSEPAAFQYMRRVIATQWHAKCDDRFNEVIDQCRKFSHEPVVIAAWTAKWCIFQAAQTSALVRHGVGVATAPSLARESVNALAAQLQVEASAVLEIADSLAVTERHLVPQVLEWAADAHARGLI